jgi:putative transposase
LKVPNTTKKSVDYFRLPRPLWRKLKKWLPSRGRTVVGEAEVSASTLATEIALRSSEQWALKRYLTMDALEAMEKPNPQLSRH